MTGMVSSIKHIYRILLLALMVVAVGETTTANTRVSLLTVGPGREMYQLEGHSALRIQTDNGDDIAVNWGVFDFHSPNFAYRFIKGETDYSIGATNFTWFLGEYAHAGRYVTEQELMLTEAEAAEVVRLVTLNMQPENREYRYNYLLDNCATRPLAIVEKALAVDGAKLQIAMEVEPASIREDMRRYHANYPSYQLFIDFALGSGIDQEASLRERAFAPLFLSEMVDHTKIVMADGTTRRLAGATTTLLHSNMGETSEEGIPAWLIIAVVTLSAIAVTVLDVRRRRVTQWYDAVYYTLIGLLGLISAFLIFISEHEATSPNINILWADPVCLIIPLLIWFKKCKRLVFYLQIINFALILVWLIGQPLFHQSLNLLFIPLVLSDMLRSASYIYLNRRCHDRIKA